jgi:hypothetical protein
MRADLVRAQGPRVVELHQQAAEGYASLASTSMQRSSRRVNAPRPPPASALS